MEEWADCGKKCPVNVDVDPWSTDDTLEVTHHNMDLKEIMNAAKLLGIMASSLLLIGLLVIGLGILMRF